MAIEAEDARRGRVSGGHRDVGGGWRRGVVWLVVAVAVGAGVAVAARAAGVRPLRVTSASMSPAMDPGDWIVVRDFDRAGRRAVRRGDIVLFRLPFGTAGRAIKRVVAVGGDRVAIDARSVTVNGRVIAIAGAPSVGAAQPRVETVKADDVFVLGDNAAVSIDSRSFGHLPANERVARVLFVIATPAWPLAIATTALVAAIIMLISWRARRRRRGG